MALPKTLQRLLAEDDRIDEIWDERGDDNGYWIYFKPGWINDMTETHCIHEDTVKECFKHLRFYVRQCQCDNCLAAMKRDNERG